MTMRTYLYTHLPIGTYADAPIDRAYSWVSSRMSARTDLAIESSVHLPSFHAYPAPRPGSPLFRHVRGHAYLFFYDEGRWRWFPLRNTAAELPFFVTPARAVASIPFPKVEPLAVGNSPAYGYDDLFFYIRYSGDWYRVPAPSVDMSAPVELLVFKALENGEFKLTEDFAFKTVES